MEGKPDRPTCWQSPWSLSQFTLPIFTRPFNFCNDQNKNRKYNVHVKVVNICAVTAKKVKSSQEKKKETYFGYYLNLRPEHMTMVAPWSIKVNQPWF